MNDPVYILKDRYRNDAQFHALVDQLLAFMIGQRIQPYEVRDAAFIAELIYREQYVQPMIMAVPIDRLR